MESLIFQGSAESNASKIQLVMPHPKGNNNSMSDFDVHGEGGQSLQDIREAYGVPIAATSAEGAPGALPFIKPEDMQYFGRLMEDAEEESMSKDELDERKIMTLLLKIKSGTNYR
mmetsp:Transcript_1725/g.2685  ORF Transcript_1725/g.2685 Transcript_1725/m.2685 type:complete len:115 (+) Transcript_1725:328-672(+)